MAFWGCYALLCANMEYLWVSQVLPQLSTAERIKSMCLSAGLGILPEMLFAYYMMYIGYDRLVKKKAPLLLCLLEILIVLLISLTLVRLSNYYVLKYWAYNGKLAEPVLWDYTLIWRSFIYLGFSCGFALSLRLFRKQIAATRREKTLVEEKLSVELKLLQNQLHPHFLFNTLNNIYALTRKKSDLAPEAVMKLSELLHFMLYQSDSDTIPLSQELNFLEDYLSLEKIRYSDRLTIRFNKEISNAATRIIPLLLLPLVENAFKHGASEARFDSYIHIDLRQQNETLDFIIENTVDAAVAPVNKGQLGLRNIRRRLGLLYKEHRLDVVREANRFRVHLFLNIDSYGKA